jgi:hypothetical protein
MMLGMGPKLELPLKRRLISSLPPWARSTVDSYIAKRHLKKFQNLPVKQQFTRIYTEQLWGSNADKNDPFYSGSGSHESAIVNVYVDAVQGYLSGLGGRPSAVDLGCGDFAVGARLRHLCSTYVACDIVEPLIDFNRSRYSNLHVDFRTLDLTQDDLPVADVAFLRQVLQHLSNTQIAQVLERIARNFRYLILSEHLPATDGFVPNADKKAGPDIRVRFGSGVVITAPPFNLAPKETIELCVVPEGDGKIVTTAYRLS